LNEPQYDTVEFFSGCRPDGSGPTSGVGLAGSPKNRVTKLKGVRMKLFPFCERRRQGRAGFFWAVLLLLPLIFSAPLHAGPKGGIRPHGYASEPPYNPQPDYWREFDGVKASTEKLLNTIGATNLEAGAFLQQIQTNSQFLHDKWNVWFGTHFRSQGYARDDAYLASLKGDNWQLGKARKEKDAAKTLASLRVVAVDLQIKADNCRSSGDGLGKEIKVKVHTKANGKEAGGYEVFFVSEVMFDVKSAHDRFPRQSSPTDEKILCPGGYKLWARKNKFTSEPVAMGIGGHGETSLEVDLTVPAE
jgi:hypothetical protein